MLLRRLGRTGLMVSEIGFGAWGIGKGLWIGAEDAQSLVALRRAIEQGVNFIDTALAYGPGHSERLVGQVVASNPHLATIGAEKRGQDLNHRGLACAVGAEQREDRPRSHIQVDAVEHHMVAKRFAQSPCFNHHDT